MKRKGRRIPQTKIKIIIRFLTSSQQLIDHHHTACDIVQYQGKHKNNTEYYSNKRIGKHQNSIRGLIIRRFSFYSI